MTFSRRRRCGPRRMTFRKAVRRVQLPPSTASLHSRLVHRHGRLDQRLERRLVYLLADLEIDRAARIALEARVEQLLRVLDRRALRERELHRALVAFAGAYNAVVR